MTANASGPVILAYDGSAEAGHAIGEAGNLLSGGSGLVVNVWHARLDSLLTRHGAPAAPVADAAAQLMALHRGEAERVAAEGVEIASSAGFDASSHCVEGHASVWPTICELAVDRDARCVVVGSRGRSGARSTLLGSVSTGVVHHCARPVVVVAPAERRP